MRPARWVQSDRHQGGMMPKREATHEQLQFI